MLITAADIWPGPCGGGAVGRVRGLGRSGRRVYLRKPTCRSHGPGGHSESFLASAEAGQARGVLESYDTGPDGVEMKGRAQQRKVGEGGGQGRERWPERQTGGRVSVIQTDSNDKIGREIIIIILIANTYMVLPMGQTLF